MTPDAIRDTVLTLLAEIAAGEDVDAIDPADDLREQLDLDSMDFLFIVQGIHARVGVEIPEADYPRLVSLDDVLAYLAPRAG